MDTHRRFAVFARVAGIVAVLFLVVSVLPSSAAAGQHRKMVGKYFFADDFVAVAGGALLYDDCTHDGGLITAPRFGPPSAYKLVPTTWVNNPDPTIPPYNAYSVPDVLQDKARLFLCFNVVSISGPPPPFPVFCDWAPRDMHVPLEVDLNGDGIRDMLLDVEYNRGPKLCSDQ